MCVCVGLFVCLFACLLACLLACLFVCVIVGLPVKPPYCCCCTINIATSCAAPSAGKAPLVPHVSARLRESSSCNNTLICIARNLANSRTGCPARCGNTNLNGRCRFQQGLCSCIPWTVSTLVTKAQPASICTSVFRLLCRMLLQHLKSQVEQVEKTLFNSTVPDSAAHGGRSLLPSPFLGISCQGSTSREKGRRRA